MGTDEQGKEQISQLPAWVDRCRPRQGRLPVACGGLERLVARKLALQQSE